MSIIKKINNDYYVEFYGNGLLFQKKAGMNLEDAVAMKEMIDRLNSTESQKLVARDISWDSFKEALLMTLMNQHTEQSCRRYENLVTHFEGFLKKSSIVKMSQVTPKIIEEYKQKLLKSEKVGMRKIRLINFTLLLLKDIFDHSINLGYLNDNPCHHAEFVKGDKENALRILSQEEISALNAYQEERGIFLATFLFETGLRIREVCQLKFSDVNLKESTLSVFSHQSVSGIKIQRTIPLQPQITAFLRLEQKERRGGHVFLNENKPFQVEAMQFVLIKLFKEAGILKPFSPIFLRDTFAVNLIGRKLNLMAISRLLGLSDIAGAMRYFSAYSKLR